MEEEKVDKNPDFEKTNERNSTGVKNSEEASKIVDHVGFLWNIVSQLCSIIAVENLDESLSMSAALKDVTHNLIVNIPHSLGIVSIIDLILYSVLKEWSEKRVLVMSSNKKGHGSPFFEYCCFLQNTVGSVLSKQLLEHGFPSLTLNLLEYLINGTSAGPNDHYQIAFDAKFTPLMYGEGYATVTVANRALMKAINSNSVRNMSGEVIGDDNDKEESTSEEKFKVMNGICELVGERCKATIESCARSRFFGIKVVLLGDVVAADCGDADVLSDDIRGPYDRVARDYELELLVLSSEVEHTSDPRWRLKELIEDEYVEELQESLREVNGLSTEVAANKILERCFSAVKNFCRSVSQEIYFFKQEEDRYTHLYQQQLYQMNFYYSKYQGHPPDPNMFLLPMPPVKDSSRIAFAFSESDLEFLNAFENAGNSLIIGAEQRTNTYISLLSSYNDYFEELATMFSGYLQGTDAYRRTVFTNKKQLLYSLKNCLEKGKYYINGVTKSEPAAASENSLENVDFSGLVTPKPSHSVANRENINGSSNGSGDHFIVNDVRALDAQQAKVITEKGPHPATTEGGNEKTWITNVNVSAGTVTCQVKVGSMNSYLQTCRLRINDYLTIKKHALISAYEHVDPSGLVGKFLQAVGIFAKVHGLASEREGFLSPYSWSVLAVHVLLRHRIVPCLTPQSLSGLCFCGGVDVSYVSNMTKLPVAFEKRLSKVTLIDLLHLFFFYYSRVFEVKNDIVSLRKPSMPKFGQTSSRLNPTEWRLCIEDPFENVDSLFPNDLGKSLTTPKKQDNLIKIFNCARKCIELSVRKPLVSLCEGLECLYTPGQVDRWQYA